jgi:hypothetical protein
VIVCKRLMIDLDNEECGGCASFCGICVGGRVLWWVAVGSALMAPDDIGGWCCDVVSGLVRLRRLG